MQIGAPRDELFYPTLTIMMDYYNVNNNGPINALFLCLFGYLKTTVINNINTFNVFPYLLVLKDEFSFS